MAWLTCKRQVALAVVLSLLGVAVLDQGIALWLAVDPAEMPLTPAGYQRLRWLRQGVEFLGLVVLCLAAFRIARPGGIGRDEASLVWLILAGQVVGRSFLGIGEGWSTDFLVVQIGAVLMAFALLWLWAHWRGQ